MMKSKPVVVKEKTSKSQQSKNDNNKVGKLAEELRELSLQPPDKIGLSLTVLAPFAGRVAMAQKMVSAAQNLSEGEALAYLLISGAEKELERMANVWLSLQEENNN